MINKQFANTATASNDFYDLSFKFIPLPVSGMVFCLLYSYNDGGNWFRGRSRKIYEAKDGRFYFKHGRTKVYLEVTQ